jgi:iron complex outermembrane receptor protein
LRNAALHGRCLRRLRTTRKKRRKIDARIDQGNVVNRKLVSLALAAWLLHSVQAVAQSTSALKKLSVDELLDLRVTSVSKRSEPLSDAAAAIFVLTSDAIRRSGATTLTEALRLAPNLQVARIDTVNYAISARGFNNAIGNKLLVLVDGRTVYTPLYSGVFWDQQDVLLEDVERIEIITGPGATLWGANAVNGVINVITRSASDTTGSLVVAGAGVNERSGAARFGTDIGTGAIRFYAKYAQWDHTTRTAGGPALDDWQRAQVGFRSDWESDGSTFTLQGDAYDGSSQDRGSVGPFVFGEIAVSGFNLLGRWQHTLSGGSNVHLQMYFDHSAREDFLFYDPTADILDLDFQHAIAADAHQIIWGGGYRHARDDIGAGLVTTFIPPSRTLRWGNLFVQDEVTLSDSLRATVGLKLEGNDYTGVEYLPSLRLAWKPVADRLVWGSLSRAVRAPARFDRDVRFPATPPFLVVGGPHFQSEVADVVELGYRTQSATITYSLTGFVHFWDRLRSGSALPVVLENKIEGTVAGVEAWAEYRPFEFWQLSAGVTYLQEDLRLKAGSTDPVGVDNPTLRNDPDYHWQLRSSFELPRDFQLDLQLRRMDALPNPQVPAYTELDVRLAWLVGNGLELSLAGRNLLHERHAEYGEAAARSEVERSVYGQVRWHF